MRYYIDKSSISSGVFTYTTDSGCSYLVDIREANSEIWTLDFIKLSGNPSELEVFKIMKTLTDSAMEFVYQKNIQKAILFISGDNKEEIDKKTRVFQRWLIDDWDIEVLNDIEINVSGLRGPIYTTINGISITRKQKIVQDKISTDNNFEFKFCYNCGNKNEGFQFCPNCGTNLKN